jgi:hypothetical protein
MINDSILQIDATQDQYFGLIPYQKIYHPLLFLQEDKLLDHIKKLRDMVRFLPC